MIVVSGIKTVRKSVGRVADFCPICRGMQPFQLAHIGKAAHVYGVALGDGDTIYYEAQCETCGIHFSTHARRYANIASNSCIAFEELLESCGPSRPEQIRKELEQAERMRAGTLTPEERRAMMAETFEFLNEHARFRRNTVGPQEKSNGSCTTSIIVFCLAYMLLYGWDSLIPEHPIGFVRGACVMLAFLIAGMSYTLWQIYDDTRRFVLAQVLPNLARALKPLNPTQSELQHLLERFRKRKFTLAKCLADGELERAVLCPLMRGPESTHSESDQNG